jgi:hypothetical protein
VRRKRSGGDIRPVRAKNVILLFAHAIVLLTAVFLAIITIRYVLDLFSGTLGDKAIPVLYFLIALAAGTMAAGYLLGKISVEGVPQKRALKFIELGIPLLTIVVTIAVTLIRLRNL